MPEDHEIRDAARAYVRKVAGDEIEIDDNAQVNRMDDPSAEQGAWVAAWVWVSIVDFPASKPRT